MITTTTTTATPATPSSFTVGPQNVPSVCVLDMITSALDSASIRHWLRRNGEGYHFTTVWPDGVEDTFDPSSLAWLGRSTAWDYATYYFAPFLKGGAIVFYVEEDDDPSGQVQLDLTTIERGLRVMQERHPHDFAYMLERNGDSLTADRFIQCCVFGEAG